LYKKDAARKKLVTNPSKSLDAPEDPRAAAGSGARGHAASNEATAELDRRAFSLFRELYVEKLRLALQARQQDSFDIGTINSVIKSLWNSQPSDRRERFLNQARESMTTVNQDCELLAFALQDDFYTMSSRQPVQLPIPAAAAKARSEKTVRLVVPQFTHNVLDWHTELSQDISEREEIRLRTLHELAKIIAAFPFQCWSAQSDNSPFPVSFQKMLQQIEVFLYSDSQSLAEYTDLDAMRSKVEKMLCFCSN